MEPSEKQRDRELILIGMILADEKLRSASTSEDFWECAQLAAEVLSGKYGARLTDLAEATGGERVRDAFLRTVRAATKRSRGILQTGEAWRKLGELRNRLVSRSEPKHGQLDAVREALKTVLEGLDGLESEKGEKRKLP